MTDWVTVWGIVDKGGVIAILFVILITGVRRWWVFGWVYREEKARSDEWRALALSGTKIAEVMADQAKTEKARSMRRGTGQ